MSYQQKYRSPKTPTFISTAVITLKTSSTFPVHAQSTEYSRYDDSRPVIPQTKNSSKNKIPDYKDLKTTSTFPKFKNTLKIISGNLTVSKSSTNLSIRNESHDAFSNKQNSLAPRSTSSSTSKSAPDLRALDSLSSTMISAITYCKPKQDNSMTPKAGTGYGCPCNPATALPNIKIKYS